MTASRRIAPAALLAALSVLAGCASSHTHATTSAGTTTLSSTTSVSSSTTTKGAVARRHTRHARATGRSHHARSRAVARNSSPAAHGGSGPAPTHRSSLPHHTPSTSTRPAAFVVTLLLHGGGRATISACGSSHRYRTYPTGSSISFSGKVTPVPSGHWKVKLHLKACRGGSFTDFAKLDSRRDKHTGAFSGTFSAPAPGRYSVHAVLYLGGSPSTKSLGHHLATS